MRFEEAYSGWTELRIPATVVNQVVNMLPVQVGYTIRYFGGEEDGLFALMLSAGASVHTAWPHRRPCRWLGPKPWIIRFMRSWKTWRTRDYCTWSRMSDDSKADSLEKIIKSARTKARGRMKRLVSCRTIAA
ncbi:MAG: hypothetical protein JEZ02_07995 [Desulfatibacillum sp.]|nr:hypothetical protein [Desulfatibacillum sp.]